MEIGIIVLIILIIVMVVLLTVELAQYRNFVDQRDFLISQMIDLSNVVNSNADVQDKMKDQIIVIAQELDLIEKILGVHSQALKIVGPLMVQPNDIGIPPVSKT